MGVRPAGLGCCARVFPKVDRLPFFAFRAVNLPTFHHSPTYPILTTQLPICSPNMLCSVPTWFMGIPWLDSLPALPDQF